jgi:NAD(P)H-dependent flavin oxidoreductase YrpB (nitropropane dioxygenase family)
VTGTVAAMALYAGQGVGQVTEVIPAEQVVAELAQDTARLLRRRPRRDKDGRER